MSELKRRLLLVGGNGMLAQKIASSVPAEYSVVAVDLPEFDITDRTQVLAETGRLQPDVIINCAAYTNVDGAESHEDLATLVNGVGPGYLAEAAREIEAVLVHISTDYVFDGRKESPYLETDRVAPLSAYGRSKLVGEQTILESGLDKYFIIRTSWLYGPGGKNFVATILRLAAERNELRIVADQIGSPTYTGDLADAIFNLLTLPSHKPSAPGHGDSPHAGTVPFGIYHFANGGQCSWYEFAEEIIAQAREHGESLKAEKVTPIKTGEYPLPAQRPAYSVFSKDKYRAVTGALVPAWQEGLQKFFECRDGSSVMGHP